ncbi:MAG: ABC transporter, partial [Bacteroidia bacterium]
SYLMSKVTVQFSISAIQAFAFVLVGNSITGIKGMNFEYWLVLFSAWAASNMLGLVISDSFKAVVTIYILIPFLVIPQIILSGIIVKYEKLNPNLSSPTSIPIYGEMIIARWGYEALAVKQFMYNDYERELYDFDKRRSIARFKRDYWCSELIGKVDHLLTDLKTDKFDENSIADLEVLRNEIEMELKIIVGIDFKDLDSLVPEKVNPESLSAVRKWLELVNKIYIREYNKANNDRDAIITAASQLNPEAFIKFKEDYFNLSLEEFVTNSKDGTRLLEYKGRLIQKLDPIYFDPDPRFLKAHFYAPRKMLFGRYIDTFIVNILVIWSMTILTYLALYFRLLKRLLDSIEEWSDHRKGLVAAD